MDQDLIDALRVILDRARQHIPAYCHRDRDGENDAHVLQTDACNRLEDWLETFNG
jgi:hypothetical protein